MCLLSIHAFIEIVILRVPYMSGIVKTLRTGEKLSAKALFSWHPLIYTTQKKLTKKVVTGGNISLTISSRA